MHSNHENNTPSFSWSGFQKKTNICLVGGQKAKQKNIPARFKLDIKTKANGYTFRLFHCM